MVQISSKERVFRAIGRQPVDRVPKGELCVDDRVVGAFLGVNDVCHEHRREFADRLRMDLWCMSIPPDFDLSPLESSPFGSTDWNELARWAKETDKFPLVLIDGPFGWGIRRWGFETFLLKVVRNDPDVAALVRDVEVGNIQHIEKAMDMGAAGIILGDDIAYQNGLIIAPEMLREGFFPSLSRQALFAREKGLPIFFHSDGNLEQVLDDIPRLGFNGLQCIEEAAGMDLGRVRIGYGPQLCLWGNLDPVYLTEPLSPGVIERKVREVVRAGGMDSGFIFGSSSGLFQWVRPELVQQVYEAVETVWQAP